MGKIAIVLLSAIVGGFAAVVAIVFWFGWGLRSQTQTAFITPTRADYVDLILTITALSLSAIGVAITVGALVIGVVALKTLREIKDDAASEAKSAAAGRITETMAAELEPKVQSKVQEALPSALRTTLLTDGHQILTEMAQRGELDEVLERVAARIQGASLAFAGEANKEAVDDWGDQN